jgi:hypothetical protein
LPAVLVFMAGLLPTGATAADTQLEGGDSAAIAAAIRQTAPGDTIRLPSGTLEIVEPVRPMSSVNLVGAAQDKTRIVNGGTEPASSMEITGCQDVEIAHLTLGGRGNPLVRDGITGADSRRPSIHHVTFCDLGRDNTSFSHGVIFSGNNPTMERGVTDSTISDCRFERIGVDHWISVDRRNQSAVRRNVVGVEDDSLSGRLAPRRARRARGEDR